LVIGQLLKRTEEFSCIVFRDNFVMFFVMISWWLKLCQ